MIRAGRLWDDRVYGIVRYGYGERTEMGGHVDGGQSAGRQSPNILS
jgi:hypothetical protein